MRLKRIGIITLFLILVVCMIYAVACREFTVNAYKTLSAGATIYEQLYPAFLEAHQKGLITDDQRQRGHDLAVKYWAAYHLAADALVVYNETNTAENKDKVNVAIGEAVKYLTDMEAYIRPLIGGQ